MPSPQLTESNTAAALSAIRLNEALKIVGKRTQQPSFNYSRTTCHRKDRHRPTTSHHHRLNAQPFLLNIISRPGLVTNKRSQRTPPWPSVLRQGRLTILSTCTHRSLSQLRTLTPIWRHRSPQHYRVHLQWYQQQSQQPTVVPAQRSLLPSNSG